MPSKANLAIYQGDDYAAVVAVLDSSGAPADLTDLVAKAHIRVGYADTHPEVVMEIGTTVNMNYIDLSISAADTEKLSGNYRWDLQLLAPDGKIVTILAGVVTVTREVTRAGYA
jgi:hypothetical protein